MFATSRKTTILEEMGMCRREEGEVYEMSDLATVTDVLVASSLDYSNTLYVGLPLNSTLKLQLAPKAAARLLTGAGYREQTL